MFKRSYCNTKFFSPLTPSVHPFTIATGFPRLLRPPGAPQGRQLQEVLHGQRQRCAERCRALRGRRHAVERCRGLGKLGLRWLAGLLWPEIVKLAGANWWCFEFENDLGGGQWLEWELGLKGQWLIWLIPIWGKQIHGLESWVELTH